MALEREKIFDTTSVKALREEINSLKGSLAQMAESGEDCKETTEQLYAAEKQLASAMAVRRGEQNASATSIAGMEQQLKALQGTLRGLSEDQKKSDWAKNMVKQAEELSEKLNHAKQDIGDFRNNIGRYADSVDEAFGKMGISVKGLTGPMKLAGGAVKDLGGAMKALFANPWMLLIAGIVMVLKKLVDAFKNNKKAMEGFKKGLEPLKPIMNAFNNVLGLVGEALGKIVGWISDKLAKAFQWLLGVLPTVVNAVIDAINFISLPARKFWEFMLEGAEAVVNLVGLLPGMGDKMKKVAETINKVQDKLSQGFQHVSFDLTGLTAATEEDTKATEDNTKAQNDAAKAAEERAKKIEKLKKRLDDNEKDEIQKLKEKYEEERKLIKGNAEYEKKLKAELDKNIRKIENERIANEFAAIKTMEEEKLELLDKNSEEYYNKNLVYQGKLLKDLKDLADTYFEKKGDYLSRHSENDAMGIVGGILTQNGISTEGLQTLQEFEDKLLLEVGKLVKKYNDAAKELQTFWANNYLASMQTSLEASLKDADKTLEKELFRIEKKYSSDGHSFWDAIFDPSLNKNIAKRIDEEYNAEMDNLVQKASYYAYDIENYTLTEEKKLELQKQYGEASQQIFDEFAQKRAAAQENYDATMLEAERRRVQHSNEINALWRDSISRSMSGVVNILGNVEDAWANSVDAQVASGKKSQDWANKQYEKMKGIQIASAMINALLSANEAYSSLASIPYVGPALGAAAAAAALASGIANAVLIKNTKVGDSTTSGGSTATMIPSMVDTTPYEYTRTLNTEEEEAVLNKPVWVSVRDIESGLNQAKVTDRESTY